MGRHKNNAIILTTIQGELGPQGFQGADGQACYTGTGDPNTLSFSFPDYSGDPADTNRGTETLYYQDTVTGEVWTALFRTNKSQASPTWRLFTINTTGASGDRGATALDKVDINLATEGNVIEYTTVVTDQEIVKVMFPGTTTAPDFSEVKIIGRVGLGTRASLTLKDSDGTTVAEGNIIGQNISIQDLTVSGTFPVDYDVLTLHLTIEPSTGTFVSPYVALAFLSIR